jgi:hypothetical protein
MENCNQTHHHQEIVEKLTDPSKNKDDLEDVGSEVGAEQSILDTFKTIKQLMEHEFYIYMKKGSCHHAHNKVAIQTKGEI